MGCKLVTWRDYLEYHKANDMKKPQQQQQQQPQKVCGGAAKKTIPEYTAVYDEETRTVKLQLWDEYIKANRPKWTQSYAAVYDPATQSVKAIYWRQYKEEYLKKEVKEAKKEVKTAMKAAKAVQKCPDQTVVYDPKTQTAQLQSLSQYLKTNKPVWNQAYAAIYEPASQSVKLVYWKQYLENYLAKDLEARKPKKLPEQTVVYDPKTKGLKLQLLSEYQKEKKPKWTQSYAAVYDQASQSVKLVFWKQYLESYLAKDLEARKTKKLPEQTVVCDPKTKGVKLQLLSEYLKANKPKWTQAYAAVYDPATQSVKLVYWKQYLEKYLAKDLEARKPKRLPEQTKNLEARKPQRLPEQTIVYDPKTKGVRLQLWSDYERENKRTWKQDYAAIYDGETKSVKLVYWKDYVENYLPFDIKARETMQKKQNQKES